MVIQDSSSRARRVALGSAAAALVLLTGCVAVPMDAYDPGAPVVYSDAPYYGSTYYGGPAYYGAPVYQQPYWGPAVSLGIYGWRRPRALARAARAWLRALATAARGRRRSMAPSSRRGRWAHAASAGRRGRPRSTPAVRCQPLAARHRNRQPGRQRRWARRPQYALSGERRPAPEWAPAKCPMIGPWPSTRS